MEAPGQQVRDVEVGPSPAPGSGRPATDTSLGRIGLIVIIVIGLLYLAGWVAWAIVAPDVEVKIHYHHHHRDDSDPGGPGRLTIATPDGESPRLSLVPAKNPL